MSIIGKKARAILGFAGVTLLTACSTINPNYKSDDQIFAEAEAQFRAQFGRPPSVDAEAQAMVGKPIAVALERLGPPTRSGSGLYTWDRTSYHTYQATEFQQTGTECRQQVIGMTPGGNGIAPMPIHDTTCSPSGHDVEVQRQGVADPSLICVVSADTDQAGIITKFDLSGCSSGF